MFNPIHILKGWFRSYIYAPKEAKTLSEERLDICRSCDFAVEKAFLQFRDNGTADNVKVKACSYCGCPVIEKSLVEEEHCPLNLWKR